MRADEEDTDTPTMRPHVTQIRASRPMGGADDALAHRAFGSSSFDLSCPGGVAPQGADAALATACGAASAAGILQAIGVFSMLFLWAAVHFLLAARRLEPDLDESYT